jgi:hypothetical protein
MARRQAHSTTGPVAPPASSQPLLNQAPAATTASATGANAPPIAAPTPVTAERVAAAFGGAVVPHVGAQLPAAVPAAPPAARPHAPAALAASVEGLEEITSADLIIPRFSVVQPTSKIGKHPGHFRDSISEVEIPELKNVLLLKVRKGRVWFKSAESKDADCASDDMMVPSTRIATPVSKECAGCPQAKWSENKDFKRCHETYTLLILHDGMPYFLTFKSAAIKHVKKLLTQLALRGAKEKRAAYAYKFDVTLQMEEFDVGKAYMPRFERLAVTTTDEFVAAKALFTQFASARPTFDPPEAQAGAGGGAGADDKDAPYSNQF